MFLNIFPQLLYEMEKLSYDAIVLGAGLSGLMAAHEIGRDGFKVAIISKVFPTRSHSSSAEGGIAAYIPGNSDPNDDPDYMTYDTVKGGDYLVDQDAAELLSAKSGEIAMTMERWGTLFNRQPDGRVAVRYFGVKRILGLDSWEIRLVWLYFILYTKEPLG